MVEAFDYSEFIDLAREMFTQFGREITLQKLGEPLRLPRKLPQQNIIDSVLIHGLFAAPGQGIEWEQTFQGLVRRDEHGFYVPALGPGRSLAGFHLIVDGNTTWKVENIDIFKPGRDEIFGFFSVAE